MIDFMGFNKSKSNSRSEMGACILLSTGKMDQKILGK